MFRKKRTTILLNHPHETIPLRIVADGLIATGVVGDRRMLPVLIVDAAQRADIREYIEHKSELGMGDVVVQWISIPGRKETVELLLRFVRPMEMAAILSFDLIRNYGVLVDQILTSGGFYLQAGRDGDSLHSKINIPRLLVEVPNTGFGRDWDKLYLEFTIRKMRVCGLDRSAAKRAARDAIRTMREFCRLRMNGVGDSPL